VRTPGWGNAPRPFGIKFSFFQTSRGREYLDLTHRSTREILTVAEALLGGELWDDLDGGTDTLPTVAPG
jgi:hypothetical protein